MYIKDNEREYEEGWRENILKEFMNKPNSPTVTVVWENIPFHLSDDWMSEVFMEVEKDLGYKPLDWSICANVIYVTFQRKGSGDRMEALQKACYGNN